MFSKIWACLYLFVNVDKYNPPSIVDLIIYPLGHFALMIFVVGCTLYRWADTVLKPPMHPDLATAEFSYFVSCLFFVVGS